MIGSGCWVFVFVDTGYLHCWGGGSFLRRELIYVLGWSIAQVDNWGFNSRNISRRRKEDCSVIEVGFLQGKRSPLAS